VKARRAVSNRRLRLAAAVAAGTVLIFPVASQVTHHPDETVTLLMPPALACLLWWGWPRVRHIAWWKYAGYVAVMVIVLASAEVFAAHIAGGRLLWPEVFWALYFTVAWRLAWGVWTRTVGRIGERYRRWGQRTRHTAGGLFRRPASHRRRLAALALAVRPLRAGLALLIFAPLVFGALIHRIKIGNPVDKGECACLPIEDVAFQTTDGLTISGWFLPEAGSDSTVVICHGLGANKGNFGGFLSVFHGRGYNALIFDFRGHGGSDGHTCTFGLFEAADVRAAVGWLKRERPAQSRHVFGLGSSMGAMALVREAAEDPRIEGIVLDSCYVSAPLFAQQHLGRMPIVGSALVELALASLSLHAGRSLWDLDASAAIATVSPRPIFLIHGRDDVLISPVNLSLLYDLARPPKQQWLGPGPHSNILTEDFEEYQERVIELFDRARGASCQPRTGRTGHGSRAVAHSTPRRTS
jgi:fermentation-respiration switch protein FrsA (DUF1100 family)